MALTKTIKHILLKTVPYSSFHFSLVSICVIRGQVFKVSNTINKSY